MRVRNALAIVILLSAFASLGLGQDKPVKVTVPGTAAWIDTGIELATGDTLLIEATGTIRLPGAKDNGPEGLARGWRDLLLILPVNEAGRGALVGRIGDRDASQEFLVGARRQMRVGAGGKLFLGLNLTGTDKASGEFQVTVVRTAAVQTAAASPAAIVSLPQELLDTLPPRVQDAQGTPGDRVNFLIVGAEDQVTSALSTAGWVQVDKSSKDAVLRGILASISKQSYVTLPMSTLQLFGRGQDYGYAQADPLRVIASRHHFRIWKAPFQLDGQTVWAGAGTHDIGFDRDQRNNSITHKIDPDVDLERDYIGRSLTESGLVVKTEYLTPKNTVREARTAHGEAFHSDGRTLVVYLKGDSLNFAPTFGGLFCSVLKQNNPDGGEWGPCSQYLEATGPDDLPLPAIPPTYRVLIVPGIFSSCASDSPAFQEGQKAMQERYGVTVEIFNSPNDSSEANAEKLATYLREHSATDSRKYLVVGYSKGGPDVQTALAKQPGTKDFVAAFITVAGAIGGSPLADPVPGKVDRWASMLKFGNCQGDLSTGYKSLRTDVRREFLQAYPFPVVPTYSLAAISDLSTTSKALQKGWELMSAFARAHDGQLSRESATVPGAKFLGAAKADHLAVALPFDKSTNAEIRSVMDKARYPRAALLEALVRFVLKDLEAK